MAVKMICLATTAAVLLGGCGPWNPFAPKQQTPSVTAAGTNFVQTKGSQFSIVLRSWGDGGYQPWSLDPSYDNSVVTFVSSASVIASNPQPGDFGVQVFNFSAAGTGSTQLKFTTLRSWDATGSATSSIFPVRVN